jgi:hypothetical protein
MRDQDRKALHAVHEALLDIRLLSLARPGEERQKSIHDLAHAVHNIPKVIYEGHGEALEWLVEADLAQLELVYERYGGRDGLHSAATGTMANAKGTQ